MAVLGLHLFGSFQANIEKGTMCKRVDFISQVQTQVLIKFQFQNLNQAFTLKSQPHIIILTKLKPNILTKFSFRIFTKIQLRNLNQTSAAIH